MNKWKNSQLFKDRITVSNYDMLIRELTAAIDSGTSDLTALLFGTQTPDLYSNHGTYKPGHHNYCAGLSSERYTEKRLCKCMYYRNSTYSKRCGKCAFQDYFDLIGDYKITDYEVPAFYYGDGIGKIDLIISMDTVHYATEVKPYKGNSESLLRMIAEIMTYTEGYPPGTYKKAIAFFEKNQDNGEKTAQQKEFETENPALLTLLKKADITIFCFKEINGRAYQICKL